MGEWLNNETAEQVEWRAGAAVKALKAAVRLLERNPDAPEELARHLLIEKRKTWPTRDDAHAQIGAMTMATKALAEVLSVNVAIVASAPSEDGPDTTGVDAWASDLFDLAHRFEIGAGAMRAAHAMTLSRQTERLAHGCVEARHTGERIAGPLFDRSRIEVETPAAAGEEVSGG